MNSKNTPLVGHNTKIDWDQVIENNIPSGLDIGLIDALKNIRNSHKHDMRYELGKIPIFKQSGFLGLFRKKIGVTYELRIYIDVLANGENINN